MKYTGNAVHLLFDTGHLRFAGADILRIIQKHGARIIHVHAKDVRLRVVETLDRDRQSFLDAVLAGAFTVPGDGDLDFRTIARGLADVGYAGWFVVEAEQDPVKAPPLEYAKTGHTTLSAALRDAGYEIA
jgi:inosose dehydratase